MHYEFIPEGQTVNQNFYLVAVLRRLYMWYEKSDLK
jgi:hypothetical protein